MYEYVDWASPELFLLPFLASLCAISTPNTGHVDEMGRSPLRAARAVLDRIRYQAVTGLVRPTEDISMRSRGPVFDVFGSFGRKIRLCNAI